MYDGKLAICKLVIGELGFGRLEFGDVARHLQGIYN